MKSAAGGTNPRGVLRRVFLLGCVASAIVITLTLAGCGSTRGDGSGDAGTSALAEGGGSQAQIWTCAMHPQIRQPKPGKCPICAMDLVPVTETAPESGEAPELRLSPSARKLAEIQTATVERRAVPVEVRLAGKVEYDETRVSYVTAWVPGRLDRLHVNYTGTEVKPGDPMVSIYSPDLVAAQEELIQAVRAVENLRTTDAESLRRTAEETLHAVREKLRLSGLAPEQISEIEARRTVSSDVVIRAPIGGVVVEKNALEGQYVTTGTRIYTIADLSSVWVKLDAYESDIPWVRPGQRVEFSTGAYPGDTFKGKVAFIDPVLDSGTRTAKVRVNVANPGGKLKPEMFVHGTVMSNMGLADGGGAPLVIPASAPLITGKRAVVYVETEPGVYAGVEVTLGPRAGDFYVVEQGLEEGQRVVTNGNFKIDSAIQILAKPSMMNPGGDRPASGREDVVTAGSATNEAGHTPYEPFDVPPEFAGQVGRVFDAYLGIQHGLSHDSFEEAETAARDFKDRLASVEMGLLERAARRAWMGRVTDFSAQADTLLAADDIAAARSAFAPLSETMYAVARSFGTGSTQPAYRFYCSMAFGDHGAYWLQNTEESENPYRGSTGFHHGKLRETLRGAAEGAPGESKHE